MADDRFVVPIRWCELPPEVGDGVPLAEVFDELGAAPVVSLFPPRDEPQVSGLVASVVVDSVKGSTWVVPSGQGPTVADEVCG